MEDRKPSTDYSFGSGRFPHPMIPCRKQSGHEPLVQQIRSRSRLGSSLLDVRRVLRRTQADLAGQAGCSSRSVWQAEGGDGRLDLFQRIAGCLEVEISGRALPPGDALGPRLRLLRDRIGISRRQVGEECGISATTVAEVERGAACNVATLESMGIALGAGLALVPAGRRAGFYRLTATSSGWNAWSTPQPVLDSLCKVVGGRFDLDPCASRQSRLRKHARLYLTETDDGLSQPWHGRVYINPPYGPPIALWTAKAVDEVAAGRAEFVIGLVPARTDTRWWHSTIAEQSDVWLLRGRLAFGDGGNKAPFPSGLVAWGAPETLCRRISTAFPDAWFIPAGRRRLNLSLC